MAAKAVLVFSKQVVNNPRFHSCVVGYHRYLIENFTGNLSDEMEVHEVEEFDAPSEVSFPSN